jgi:hypothetical protein
MMDNPAIDWLSDAIWNKLCSLSTVEPKLSGIVNNFSKNEEKWKIIFDSNSPHKEVFPCLTKTVEFD